MMDKNVLIYSLILMTGVFISAVSQVLLKKAALKQYDSKIKEYLNPLVIFAYMLFFGTTLVSVIAYKVVPLSLGPVLEASSYIYVTIFGVKIFGEKINGKKLIALSLIIIGILISALM